MRDFLGIPEACKLSKFIPSSKFTEMNACIESIEVIGLLKPNLTSAVYSEKDMHHIEEIIILQVRLNQLPDDIVHILRVLFRSIRYQCIFVLCFQDKVKISTCRLSVGKIDDNKNILKSIMISCWIHPDLMSSTVSNAVGIIRATLNTKNDLASMYLRIHQAVVEIHQGGTSFEHAKRIITGLLGKAEKHEVEEILQYCTPIQYHQRINPYKSKFAKNNRYSNYWNLYDHEDIWYGLNRYEKTRNIINGQYSNMEELLYYVEGEKWY